MTSKFLYSFNRNSGWQLRNESGSGRNVSRANGGTLCNDLILRNT